jgi:hypothetical protein
MTCPQKKHGACWRIWNDTTRHDGSCSHIYTRHDSPGSYTIVHGIIRIRWTNNNKAWCRKQITEMTIVMPFGRHFGLLCWYPSNQYMYWVIINGQAKLLIIPDLSLVFGLYYHYYGYWVTGITCQYYIKHISAKFYSWTC